MEDSIDWCKVSDLEMHKNVLFVDTYNILDSAYNMLDINHNNKATCYYKNKFTTLSYRVY